MLKTNSSLNSIKLRYGEYTKTIYCKGMQNINLVVAGALKIGKTTFLKSIQTILRPINSQKLFSEDQFTNIFPGGGITLSGIGEATIFDQEKHKLTTTTRFNYLGKIIVFWQQYRNEHFQQITVNLYDSPGYYENSIINLLWQYDIKEDRLGGYGTKFRITDYLPQLMTKHPTVLSVLISPGGPVFTRKMGASIISIYDEEDTHGIETLKEIIREIHSKGIRSLPLMIGFTKTDCPLPASHYGNSGEMRQWGNVRGIVDLASLPHVPLNVAWERTERFLYTLFRVISN
ncbi:MAG: hypothetical protein ACFFDT_03560 [Candidatus Hodarchaeota archaeon]